MKPVRNMKWSHLSTFLCMAVSLGTMAQPQRDSLLAITKSPQASEATRLQATADLFLRNWIAPHQDSTLALAQRMQAMQENRRLAYYGCLVAGRVWFKRQIGDSTEAYRARAKRLIPDTLDLRDRAWLHDLEALCAMEQGDWTVSGEHFKAGLQSARAAGDKAMEVHFLLLYASTRSQTGQPVEAMEQLTKALKLAETTADSIALVGVYADLASSLLMAGDMDAGATYREKNFALAERIGRHDLLDNAYANMSFSVAENDIDLAIAYTDSAIAHARAGGNLASVQAGLAMKSRFYRTSGRYDLALESLDRAIALSPANVSENRAAYLGVSRSSLLNEMGRSKEALTLARELYARYSRSKDVSVCMWVANGLSRAEQAVGNHREAFEAYKRFVHLKDSVETEENKRGVIRKEYQYEYEKQALADSLQHASEIAIQREEVRRQKVVRNGFMGGFALVALFAGVFLTQRNRIGKEKARSEELLLNILPEEVAEELKVKGEADAKLIDQVTVLFTDFKGFTAMSETLSPKELVRDLHECFSTFDRICEEHGLEKIKTIGDAYMAAGGLPTPNTTHATDVIVAALAMRDFIAEGKERKRSAGLPFFEIRIGVHTGPVVAGIVGVKKFSYDIWGDTVNTASRMESSGEVGQVNVSEATYELVKDETGLAFTPRGKVQAKGKGEMDMYFVRRSTEQA